MKKIGRSFKHSMFEAFKGADQCLQTQERSIPVLQEAVTEATESLSVSGQSLPEAEKALQRALKHIEILRQAHESEKAAIEQAGAATGHLAEATEGIASHTEQMADLATLSQYFEVAARWSEDFWTDILGMVENDVLHAGLEALDPERLAEVAKVVAEVDSGRN
jgi:hypothetical protein